MTMSEQERATFDKLAKDIDFIRRWWPLVAVIGAVTWGIVTFSINATSIYDNKIAKKEDMDSLRKENRALRVEIQSMHQDLRSFLVDFTTYKKDDSIFKLSKNTADAERDKLISSIQRKCEKIASYYTQKYSYDKNGNVIPGRNKLISH